MVSRGRRSINRSHREEEENKEEEEEVHRRTNTTTEEAVRIQEAQYLAREALRIAIEARDAAMRLKEYRSRIALYYHKGNMIRVDDTSTPREGDDNCRSF